MEEVFTGIYRTNYWQGQSKSGKGSALETTAAIREELPWLFARNDVYSILDIPCGDFFWASRMQLPPTYIAADIVPELIEDNRLRWPGRDWRVLDITQDKLPRVDLVLARDIFGHLPDRLIQRAIRNVRSSGAKYLLATT